MPTTAAGTRLHGDPGAAQVSQDKYCPFDSAHCREQQTDELTIIIIIIILIMYTYREKDKADVVNINNQGIWVKEL